MIERNYTIKENLIVLKENRKTVSDFEEAQYKDVYISLDQSSAKTGYSIIENDKLKQYGYFQTKSKESFERLNEVQIFLSYLIKNFNIKKVALENVQIQRINVKSGITLSKLLGILEHTLYINNIEYEVVSPGIWRKHCGIRGRKRDEQKKNTKDFVKNTFDIDVLEDTADAIAINCYLSKRRIKKWIE